MPTVEIVTHCWNYSRLLCYQLSSLVLHPPRAPVAVTIYYTPEDFRTCRMLLWFCVHTRRLAVRVLPRNLPKNSLLRRAIGRNLAALGTRADYILFSDCDMLFGPGAIDAIVEKFPEDAVLCYPRIVRKCTHERGDRYIEYVTEPGLHDIAPSDFQPTRYRRAIGGTQWVRGETARQFGYLPDHGRYQKPAGRWKRTYEDKPYRKSIGGGRGVALDIPNVYRIRHSRYGRRHVGVEN